MKTKYKVLLNKFTDIGDFSRVIMNFPSDINVYSNRYILDAKSILALMSLDLSKAIEVEILSDDEQEINRFVCALGKYMVE